MKKKILLLIIIPFILTGCASVNYNITIDNNLTVLEEATITGTTEYFNIFNKNYPKTIVLEWYEDSDIQSILNNNNYEHELIEKGVYYPSVFVKKTYTSLEEYTTNTIFNNQVFEDILITNNDDLITINTVKFLPRREDETDQGYNIDNLSITISLPFKVSDHNADTYSEKNNTYTWYIDSDTTEKEINLTFNKNKIYVYNFSKYVSLFLIIILVLVLIYLIRKIILKNKLNNKIPG